MESFFTPWHALLYTGFATLLIWTLVLAYRRRADATVWWRDGWPAGYRLGAVGAAIFLVGGAGDMTWHGVFGIEVGLEGGLSPTHLAIDLGGVLLLTSPLRSWWATGADRLRAVTGVVSLALGTTMLAVLLLLFMPLNAAAATLPYLVGNSTPEHLAAVAGVQGYLFATVLLVVPLLLCHRRRATPGVATALIGVLSLFTMVMYEFPSPQWTAVLGATLGAAVTDAALVRLDAVRGADAPLRLPTAGALFALCVWAGHLLGLHLAAGVRWPVELWTGTLVLTTLLAAALGGLATHGPASVRQPTGGVARPCRPGLGICPKPLGAGLSYGQRLRRGKRREGRPPVVPRVGRRRTSACRSPGRGNAAGRSPRSMSRVDIAAQP